MKKVCLFLVVVLLLGCFVGCQGNSAVPNQPTEPRSIENPDGTLSGWMKAEIQEAWELKYGPTSYTDWWSTENPTHTTRMYLGTYNDYVMFSTNTGSEALMKKTISGYIFKFSTLLDFHAYKDGEFYDLLDLYEQGIVDEEAIRIAHDHHTEIIEHLKVYYNNPEYLEWDF